MKIVLFSRQNPNATAADLSLLARSLAACRIPYRMDEALASRIERLTGEHIPAQSRYRDVETELTPDAIMVSYGGDGTFLEAVRLLADRPIPILGINSGRLGFLANVPKDSIEQALNQLKNGAYTLDRSSLLKVEGDFPSPPRYPFAFNEFTIQRDGASMISVETSIGDEPVATYWGDGVLLSTPAGSTAYSLSVGGPVVAPECACFVLAPISPHNLTMRPVVIPDSACVTFRVHTREKHAFVTLDNLNFTVRDGAAFRVTKARNAIFLVRLQNISFYDTLRNKMMWGYDRRDANEEK